MPKRFVAQPSHDPLDLSPAASCYAAGSSPQLLAQNAS